MTLQNFGTNRLKRSRDSLTRYCGHDLFLLKATVALLNSSIIPKEKNKLDKLMRLGRNKEGIKLEGNVSKGK